MPQKPVKAIAKPNHLKRNKTILLLGSERISQSAMCEVLEGAGYTVLVAGDLGTAVIMLAECPVGLLITHPYIAEVPGHEAIKYLRKKSPGMPALMVAGVLDDDRIQNEAALEPFAIFPPPFGAGELLEAVREVLNSIPK